MTENWTDNLSVFLARDESVASLVDYLLEAEQRSLVWREVFEVLTTRFALGYDDARLAVDRLQAGRVRAATGNPANEPDSKLDPIAAESYRRALNKPATRPAPDSDAWRHLLVHLESTGAVGESRSLGSDERDAVELWLAAVSERASTRATTTLVAALKLTQLAHATMQSSLDLASKRRALWQAAVGVNAIGDTYVANRGNAGCLAEGTPAHRDAIELTEACRQLAADFERLGERTLARQAVDLRGSLVTRLLGQCMGRVGEVMLESARWAVGANERERAAELCQAVVLDFARLVDTWQLLAEAPRDEVRLALEHLGHAIELRESLGFTSDDERALRRNCAAVLART